jgi:oxalate decarboxylase/phosphoglucose isomerase-like protein (cupin superfamily)
MLDDQPPVRVRPGASIYIPQGVYHGTVNTGWEPLRLLIVYAPTGPEQVLREIPGVKIVPAGELPA